MSSEGGRWPKKLRSLEGRLAVALKADGEMEEGGSRMRSESRALRELRTLTALARLVDLVEEGWRRDGVSVGRGTFVGRRTRPCSRVGWSGGA